MAPSPGTALVRPSNARLALVPWSWVQWFRWKSDRIRAHHAERNFGSVVAHVPRGARVLDVGAGDGRLAALLRDRLGCEVQGVDVTDACQTDIPFATYDGTKLPVGDATQDVVLLMYVLHHAADDAAVLAEVRRVLAPGGVVIVAEDQVETWRQRAITVGFHVWLLTFTFMGWRGKFRKLAAWRARFAAAGLHVEDAIDLGANGRLWPRNLLVTLRP